MNNIDAERIKSNFYNRLREEEKLKHRKLRPTPILAFVAGISLTGITVLAANWGVFDTLFSNFKDVYSNIQTSDAMAKSNGVTMKLSSYLADNKGIIAELVFTKDDGSSFPNDTIAIYEGDPIGRRPLYVGPSVEINNVSRTIWAQDKVSDDGKTYYCLPIVNYDIKNLTDSTLDISVDKLIYNMKESNKTIDLDLYSMYKNANVKTYDMERNEELEEIFNNVPDNPIPTKIGTTLDSVVFAKVKTAPRDNLDGMPSGDGIDVAALSSHKYDHIVGIKYTDKIQKDDIEYSFQPVNLINNDDPLWRRSSIDSDTSYVFFRIDDFEDLNDMNGVDFIVNSNNFKEGNWNIKTNFAANQDQSTVVIDKQYSVEDKDTPITLTKADISLFSTELSYEIKDSEGNLLTDINGDDVNDYLSAMGKNKVELLYSDGRIINLTDYSHGGSTSDGRINIHYDVEMAPDTYTLMNTSKLLGIAINGEHFNVTRPNE